MAAIDIDMSEFTQKTTLASTDFITGTLADGSAVKIKVSDIATVVAGMIDYPFCYRGDISSYSDGNNIVNSGFYSEGSGVNNIPDWHHIVVLNVINGIIQLAIRDTGNSFLIRVKSWEGTWSDWKQLL